MIERFVTSLADQLWYWHYRSKTESPAPQGVFSVFSKNLGPKVGLMLLLSAQYPIHFPTLNGTGGTTTVATPKANPVIEAQLLNIAPLPVSPVVNKTSAQTDTEKRYVGLILPIEGIFTSYFSSWHPGVDIAQKAGTAIKPIMGGKVIFAGWDSNGYGLSVVIDHANSYKSRYAHMSKLSTKVGEIVYQETSIGLVGTTGHSTGPHLHLEIYRNDSSINPLQIISATNKLE